MSIHIIFDTFFFQPTEKCFGNDISMPDIAPNKCNVVMYYVLRRNKDRALWKEIKYIRNIEDR